MKAFLAAVLFLTLSFEAFGACTGDIAKNPSLIFKITKQIVITPDEMYFRTTGTAKDNKKPFCTLIPRKSERTENLTIAPHSLAGIQMASFSAHYQTGDQQIKRIDCFNVKTFEELKTALGDGITFNCATVVTNVPKPAQNEDPLKKIELKDSLNTKKTSIENAPAK